MARCEDYPCCGHEDGGCPNPDGSFNCAGCGAKLPVNATSALCGLKIALACWFAFLLMEYATISVFSAFETNPWPLICIDMGQPLLGFAVSGLVLGAWRKRTA